MKRTGKGTAARVMGAAGAACLVMHTSGCGDEDAKPVTDAAVVDATVSDADFCARPAVVCNFFDGPPPDRDERD